MSETLRVALSAVGLAAVRVVYLADLKAVHSAGTSVVCSVAWKVVWLAAQSAVQGVVLSADYLVVAKVGCLAACWAVSMAG